jgi:CubicO group peptidase (beta-lactamase class C family)
MRRILGVVILLVFITSGNAAPVVKADVATATDEALRSWRVPGTAVAVVQNGEVTYLEGHGVRELGKTDPITPDTIFAIASCTKAFTATTIATLVDEGKMGWDDPVRKHLPYFRLSDPLADREVTIRDLLCHRTGLSRHDLLGLGSPWGREDILRRVAYLEPTKSFRSTYQYNNLMYLAAGEASAAAAKTSWEDTVRKRLLTPLGMSNVSFSTKDVEKVSDRARPHRKAKDGKIEAIEPRNIDNVAPAGSMNTTARELTKWVRFQLGDGTWEGTRVVSEANLNETKLPQMIIRLEGSEKELNPESTQKAYALGWLVQDYRGKTMLSHTGGLWGFRCRIVLVPSEKFGVVVLTNSGAGASGAAMHVALSSTIVDQALGLPRKDWNAFFDGQAKRLEAEDKKKEEERAKKRHRGTKPSRELTAYAGTYTEPAYGAATVTAADGGLKLSWGASGGRLEHFHYDTFTVKDGELLDEEQAVFVLGTDGEVASMKFLGVEFKRTRGKKP